MTQGEDTNTSFKRAFAGQINVDMSVRSVMDFEVRHLDLKGIYVSFLF